MAKSISLYLLRGNESAFEGYLTENARIELGLDKENEVVEDQPSTYERKRGVEGFGSRSEAFVFRRVPVEPAWLKSLRLIFSIPEQLENASQSAVVLFETKSRVFAVTYGHGFQKIDRRKIVADFGLRVSLNTLSDKKIRGVRASNLSSAFRESLDSPFQRDIYNYGMDDAVELVRSLKGEATSDTFEGTLTGANSLKFSTSQGIEQLPKIAEEALELYSATDYKATSFAFIDELFPVGDSSLVDQLDELMVDELKKPKSKNYELGLPVVLDGTPAEYAFHLIGSNRRFPDLLLSDYRDLLGAKLNGLTVDEVRRHFVRCSYESDGARKDDMSVYESLVGTQVFNGSLYAINEGIWYQLDDKFKKRVDDEFDLLADQTPLPKPTFLWPKIAPAGKKSGGKATYRYETETKFNKSLSQSTGLLHFDNTDFFLDERPQAKFEVCDLMDIPNKEIWHIKRSGRRSSILSHFFKQGRNSAENIKLPEIQKKIANHIGGKLGKPKDALDFTARINEPGWTIVFVIADEKTGGKFTIPFFSRISLRDEAREIRKYGYKVKVRFIELN